MTTIKMRARKNRKPIAFIIILGAIMLAAIVSLWYFYNLHRQQDKTYSGAKFVLQTTHNI